MAEPVPVAENLLETKLFGFSIKRLAQSFLVPLLPGIIALALNLPILLTAVLVIFGGLVGGVVFFRTPGGQDPHRWLISWLLHNIDDTEYHWGPVQTESEPAIIQDYHYSTREPAVREQTDPEENYVTDTMFGSKNTVDHIDFDYVHDNGVIVTEQAYSILIEIEPRPWLILDNKKRDAVYDSFKQFLMGVKSPIQIFTLPVPYDASRYLDMLEEANRNRPGGETPLLSHGRIQHGHWLQNVVRVGDIRDRRHFIVVTAQKHGSTSGGGGRGLLDKIPLPMGSSEAEEEKLLDEVWTRAESVKSSLPRTGVECTILDRREEVLEVMYYYYCGDGAPADLDHGWLTQPSGEHSDSIEDVNPLVHTRKTETIE